jgi:EAL domain-containing protein (putative c-di-GMP-specific phosphodiesterase class I)
MAVNLSPMQFGQPDVDRMISDVIEETDTDARRIVVELTENALIEDSKANRDKLSAIKATGVQLALDDFGTGFSSLSYLRRFPFDIVKIDRSFVQDVDVDEAAAALASSVIRIAKVLKLTSLAEGVETDGQAAWLTQAGCDQAQGFLFAKPMPPDKLGALLTNGLAVPQVEPATS